MGPEHGQHLWGEGNVAILAALAPLNVNQHPVTVDLRDLQMQAFVDTQASSVDRGEADAIAWLTNTQ
jgi:hypothetical protein